MATLRCTGLPEVSVGSLPFQIAEGDEKDGGEDGDETGGPLQKKVTCILRVFTVFGCACECVCLVDLAHACRLNCSLASVCLFAQGHPKMSDVVIAAYVQAHNKKQEKGVSAWKLLLEQTCFSLSRLLVADEQGDEGWGDGE